MLFQFVMQVLQSYFELKYNGLKKNCLRNAEQA